MVAEVPTHRGMKKLAIDYAALRIQERVECKHKEFSSCDFSFVTTRPRQNADPSLLSAALVMSRI
jgi:hypothetical protein